MLPEDRLDEAVDHIEAVAADEDLPDEVSKDLYRYRADIEMVRRDIEGWRAFVDDSEVVE